ncbi:MAG: carbamoyl-phosphate synthase large subunit [Deltaproteobacteria bacterium]|nr:carbamoyl-phosphate synthase large subunit [Deltaproteobacteria bacterium]
MPKRTDISSILLIGSGPIVIGQACEFDYSGTQACKALKEEGYRVILVNSNPATIMTDPEFADRTYIEPLTVEHLAAIIAAERPDALLPTMGGQTALNLALALHDAGVLQQYGVRLIGANVDAIRKAEDRLLFKEAMARIGLDVPASVYVSTPDEGRTALETIGLPAIIRPAFTLGGSGGSIAHTLDAFERAVAFGLAQSPVHRVLLETSVLGWKEYELEVVRDTADNVVIICSIENFDPMGVHTGDSITVAPAQTLTDKEYQRMRDAAIAIMREIGVETGGSNVQFAVNPVDGALVVVEMNPRVSRSSALASKATGYPIAKIAAKLAVGYRLDELRNDITRETSAAFEPVIDYVVTKIPRFTFEKFPTTDALLTTQMKSVGEVMAIGRTFPESLHKAIRSLEQGFSGLIHPHIRDGERLLPQFGELLRSPRPDRLWWIAEALRCGLGIDEIAAHTQVDPWFLYQMRLLIEMEESLRGTGLQPESLAQAKRLGFADSQIAEICGVSEAAVRAAREHAQLQPTYRTVDTCAAEFEAYTPYLYSTYDGAGDAPATSHQSLVTECPPTTRRKVIILGSGPNRIGQGIEFDYCCVQAVFALRAAGVEAIMINCNPETVSTDYDTADRLYFEPLTPEDALAIIRREQPEGVIVQFGGQTPLKLVKPLVAAGVTILGTAPEAIECAEDRAQFSALLHRLGLLQPPAGSARTLAQAETIAERLGFPVLVRPSFVLGGRAMRIVTDAATLRTYWHEAIAVAPEHPVLIDRYIENAVEVDVDALCDGTDVTIVGMMEHIEEAGVHSGDSSCVLPPYSLTPAVMERIAAQTRALACALHVVGLLNIQFAVQGETVYVLEANPRASRTVPFVAKVVGRPIAQYATRLMLGERLCDVCPAMPPISHFGVKSPVFPFLKFPGVDPQLGPEMRSTGEVMGIDATVAGAFLKAQTAAGNRLPRAGTVFVSVRDVDKPAALDLGKELLAAGFQIVATGGTARYCAERGLAVGTVRKVAEGSPHIVDALREGEIAMVINTTVNVPTVLADSFSIRRTTIELGLPYFTTIAAARAAVTALTATVDNSIPAVTPLQVWHQSGASVAPSNGKAVGASPSARLWR